MSIGCGRKNRSGHVLRWTCGVKPKLKAVNKPLHHCIVHGLDNPGSSATVSQDVLLEITRILSVLWLLLCALITDDG